MSNGSGLLEQLASISGVQVQSNTVLAAIDLGIDQVTKLVPAVGAAVGVVEGILSLVDPPAGSPTIKDLQGQVAAFAATVEQQLAQLARTEAGGQVKDNAEALENLLTGPLGTLTYIGDIAGWRNSPGLPLPAAYDPVQIQGYARSPILTLLGGGPTAVPPDSRPTAYWWLPVGDLPLFKPENPWAYRGTSQMFDQPAPIYAQGEYLGDFNALTQLSHPQFDLSAFHFTNDFSPTKVAGIPDSNAFNPTWVLQQSMAAVYYYLLLCGAILSNFPNDGATIPDFVGDNNFAGNLSWYHDQIRAGIVNIRPPYWTDLVPQASNGLIPASADAGVSQWSVPSETSSIWGNYGYSGTSAPASEWKRPFGALCSYNGYVAGIGVSGSQPSVDQYPNYVYPTPGQPVVPPGTLGVMPSKPGSQWLIGFYCKYLIACLWRTKLVYLGMGLKDMWNTINNLYVMCGHTPQSGPCFGDWSLKEVFQMLGSANYDTFPLPELLTDGVATSKLSLRAFLQFMNSAPPTPSSPSNSLRAVLQA